MSELLPVLQAMRSEAEAGRPSTLCVVVQTKGSTPQCPGAAMLVRQDLTTVGTLGGGCVEAEVKQRAFKLLQSNRSGLLDFLLDHDYGWDDGLICGGRMFIAATPITSQTDLGPYHAAAEALQRREPAWFPIVVEHEGKRLEYRVRLEVPPTLLIAGAGHVGQAVARLAVDLDFRVVVIDDRPDFASADRFGPAVELVVDDIASALRKYPVDPGCFVVIVTRGHQHDHQALEAVIRSPARYVGLIGSKRKTRMIFGDLLASGVSQEQVDQVHSPIGLSIDAITVPEIAVSIAAELVQVRRQDTLSLVEGPIDTTSA